MRLSILCGNEEGMSATMKPAARLAGVARDLLLPGRGIFQLTHFVTSACDARCGHCFYRTNRPSRELDLDEIGQTARSLRSLRFLLVSGGEPFLRADLPEIVERYYRFTPCANVSLPTNGLKPQAIAGAVRRILAACPGLSVSVSVSLDGPPAVHDRLRGVPGAHARAAETLGELAGLRASRPALSVGVITTLTAETRPGFEEFAGDVLGRFAPDSHTLNLWRGAGPGERPEGVAPETYLALTRRLSSLYRGAAGSGGALTLRGCKRRVRDALNEQRRRYIARVWGGGAFLAHCRAAEREAVLAEDGTVYPCELMFDRPLGNVRDHGFDLPRLLRSRPARDFVAWRRRARCLCTHECNTRTLLLLRRRSLVGALAAAALRRG